MTLAEELLTTVEKQKEHLNPEVYEQVKKNIDSMPKELMEDILVQLQNAEHLRKMTQEFNDQRMAALDEASKQLTEIKQDYVTAYKEVTKEMEATEQIDDMEDAEAILKDLN